MLWEHLVLDIIRTGIAGSGIRYWRDKSDREIDFVIPRGREVDAVECKINPDRFDPTAMAVFRRIYPAGENFLICPDVRTPYRRRFGVLEVNVADARSLPWERWKS
jgi:hypothetical protein